MRERHIGGGDCGAPGQQFASRLHLAFLGERDLVPLHELSAPAKDLLVDVDLDRADVAAAAVQGRGERQIAVFVRSGR